MKKPDLKAVPDPDPIVEDTADTNPTAAASPDAEPVIDGIAKPKPFDLNKFKSKRDATVAGVNTLLGALPCYKINEAGDFVKLHPDKENYWSPELCFVNVPIKGQKHDLLHLIDEDLAMRFLSAKRIQRFRLALATKPYDVFFLAVVPTQNLDNSWNESYLKGCELATTHWVQAVSLKATGVERYHIDFAADHDAFPGPKWLTQPLEEIIRASFSNERIIEDEKHPGLLRLIGAKQSVS
jgi:hypothetical protein